MRPGGFFGISSAICLIAIQQVTAQTCDTEVVSFQQFKASAENWKGNAVMSSQLHNYSPENCKDGNEDTFCHTEVEVNPYLMIEYTDPIKVTDVIVTARKSACCFHRVKQLVVIVTDTKPTKGKSALESGTQLGSTFIGPATSGGQKITFSSSGGVMGRYVVIQQLYEGSMNLAEVEVNKRERYRKMMKKDYKKCLENTACEECFTVIETYLPELVQANMIKEGEIPVFGVNNGKKEWKRDPWAKTLSLIEGDDIITRKTNNELITFNGTVPGYIGKRDYSWTLRRTTGLYVGPGDIVTITFPEEVVGKIRVFIGHTGKFKSRLEVKHSVMKIASPFGGLLFIWMNARKGAKPTFKGEFTIKVDNAIRAPYFIYNENTNEQWNNEIKHYSPKWAVLRIPGQLVVFVQTLKIKVITDMEATMTKIKKMMDNLEELVGLPPGSRPGEDVLKFQFGLGVAGVRSGMCRAGESIVGDNLYTKIKASDDTSYDDFFIEYGVNGLVGHEMGHGWCLGDLPDMGNQWTAETVAGYLMLKSDSPKKSRRVRMISHDLDFFLLHRMVAFNLYSKGRPCGQARFNRKQLNEGAYNNCWKWLNYFPEKAHGWDVLKDVFTLDQKSKKSYRDGTDRMVDLYCQATKHNMLPFFNVYNIRPSDETITNYCQTLPKSDLITKWLNIIECVKQSMTNGKDIRICAKMPHFPEHRGLCVISGVCSEDETNDGQQTIMDQKFDLSGSLRAGLSRNKKKTPSDTKETCFKRAEDYFKDCNNNMLQPISVTFYGKKLGNAYATGLSNIFPPQGTGPFVSARASSTYGSFLPVHSIDGVKYETKRDNFFHSNHENYPWLEIKLITPTKISEVTIFNRKDCCGDRLKNAEIRAGMTRVPDGTSNQLLTTNNVCGTYPGPAATGATIKIVCNQPIMAQYITIQLKDKATLQVTEVEITACPETDIDYYGNDLRHIGDIPDWQTCARKCSEESGCSHWTWVTQLECYLKNGGAGRKEASGKISGASSCRGE